ncbi:helix-turn-helix domain-containing protein, partial [Oscillospiraceae bacterium 44-34]
LFPFTSATKLHFFLGVFLHFITGDDTLAIGRNKAYGLVNSGTIKALKIGQHYRIPKDEFIKFVKSGVQSA